MLDAPFILIGWSQVAAWAMPPHRYKRVGVLHTCCRCLVVYICCLLWCSFVGVVVVCVFTCHLSKVHY